MNCDCNELLQYLQQICSGLKIERHNDFTYQWSTGFMRGYMEAIEHVNLYAKELDKLKQQQ